MATTMHCEPKRAAASPTNSGLNTAAVLIDTLSAPALSRLRISCDGAYAATDGKRDEHLAGHALDGVQGGVATVDAGGDIEEGDLVGALLIVAASDLHRVTGVADVLELHALDHAAVVHVQARDDAFSQCRTELP